MKDSPGIYIENLSLFSQLLREKGIPSGIQETIDAAHIIELMGLQDKEIIRQALCSIYAKTQSEQSIFNRTFDEFFVGKNIQQKQYEKQKAEEKEKSKNYDEAMEDLKYEGKPLDLNQELKEKYAKLPKEERKQLMQYIDFSMDNLRNSPFNERFMVKAIEQKIRLTDVQGGSSTQDLSELGKDLLFKNISNITEEEIPRVIMLINQLVKKINGTIARDFRKSGKSGWLEFRGTIHSSLKTGGSFYHLIYKKKRKSKKRILLLCDVSGSMLKFSHFAIRFIKSLSDVSKGLEIYLFSEGVHKVNNFSLNKLNTFENHVKENGLWGKGTNIGDAFDQLMHINASHISPSTILLILSDTKTVDLNHATESLKKIGKQSGRVIWMNPLPKESWKNVKSVSALSPYCQMLDCSTLNNLAKACIKLL